MAVRACVYLRIDQNLRLHLSMRQKCPHKILLYFYTSVVAAFEIEINVQERPRLGNFKFIGIGHLNFVH